MRQGQTIKQVGVQNFEPLPVLWFDISPLDVELESVEVLRLGLAIRTPNRRWMEFSPPAAVEFCRVLLRESEFQSVHRVV